jgi:hypothetical protein
MWDEADRIACAWAPTLGWDRAIETARAVMLAVALDPEEGEDVSVAAREALEHRRGRGIDSCAGLTDATIDCLVQALAVQAAA